VGAELFHTDGHDELIVAFRNFANAPTRDADRCHNSWI